MITIPDPEHSIGEERWLLVGQSVAGRLVVVAHTERGDEIRIINARPATRRERQTYEADQYAFRYSDDIRPECDFSGGVRGKYAQRFREELVRLARVHEVLPLWTDMGGCIALRPSGQLVFFARDDPEKLSLLVQLGLTIGAWSTPRGQWQQMLSQHCRSRTSARLRRPRLSFLRRVRQARFRSRQHRVRVRRAWLGPIVKAWLPNKRLKIAPRSLSAIP